MQLTALTLALSALASAANLTLTVPATPQLPHPHLLPPSTHATLHSSGQALHAPLTRANTFAFRDVPAGSYLLSVHSRDAVFENLRVDVGAEQDDVVAVWQTFRGNEWDNRGEKRGEGRGRCEAEVRALLPKEYYQVRQGFSPLSFLKNPMILMGLFSMALIFGMPYLMDNMDEETRAEFEEMQKSSPLASRANPAAQLQNFDLASWMAGKTDAAQGGGSGGGSARKRG
ncbi:uncharacterized protein K452DRAFT_263617 [Aplosporella prunicola CBS 121167]|uniref:ER membrane protein complex subunit 7 beta-sandwich domain-containing protein n=1 Tax=Aplosporella prunicola CBS 121167 TaxID=1176127 RepID=A0A6A6BRJ9_9PEZI|nr:uncharacterized protein K452DRAFT_263617 [Aplosporella prunicola CBS 121167]KAF2146083.1 hypothetical protein K452DRAFT_263617 [Aplosporella prunicola CBS 121167]